MTLYRSMAEAITERQKQDEEEFSEFIDRSIAVVEGLDKPKSDNALIWESMRANVDRFELAKPGEKSLNDFLSDATSYQEQMKWVNLNFTVPVNDERLNLLKENQDKRTKNAVAFIEKRNSGSSS